MASYSFGGKPVDAGAWHGHIGVQPSTRGRQVWQLVHDRLAIPGGLLARDQGRSEAGRRVASSLRTYWEAWLRTAGAGPPGTYAAAAMDASARELAVPGLATTK